MDRYRFAEQIACLVMALGAVSCGSDDTGTQGSDIVAGDTEPQAIELMTWFVTPGDVEALQALMDVHLAAHPKDTLINSSYSTMEYDAALAERVTAGTPPDVFTQHSTTVASYLVTNGADSLEPLNDFLASPSRADIAANIYPELLAAATVDGNVYALPIGEIRSNIFFYNRHVFAAHGLNPPSTIDELLTVCGALKAAGVTPIRDVFVDLLFADVMAGAMGIDAYYSYKQGGAPDETALRRGIDAFGEVVDICLDPDHVQNRDFSQDDEIAALMSDQAAMLASGDWTKGFMEQLGWTAGVDFSIIDAPGNAGLFLYTADAFSIPAGAPHLEGALSFLDTVLSTEGQMGFNRAKNATPIRQDVSLEDVDSERRFIVESMRNAKYRLTQDFDFAISMAADTFARSTPHDAEALLEVLLSGS